MTVNEIDRIILNHIKDKEEKEFRAYHAQRRMDAIKNPLTGNFEIAGGPKEIRKMMQDMYIIERYENEKRY